MAGEAEKRAKLLCSVIGVRGNGGGGDRGNGLPQNDVFGAEWKRIVRVVNFRLFGLDADPMGKTETVAEDRGFRQRSTTKGRSFS